MKRKDFFVNVCQQDDEGEFTRHTTYEFEERHEALVRFMKILSIYNNPVITPVKVKIGLKGNSIMRDSIIAEFTVWHY